MNAGQHVLVGLGRAYQLAVSPVLTAVFGPLGFGCRFTPTCSQYAIEAVRAHGVLRGSGLAMRRLCRCHPWGGEGFDPVPSPPVPFGNPPDGTGKVNLRGGDFEFHGDIPAIPVGGPVTATCEPPVSRVLEPRSMACHHGS